MKSKVAIIKKHIQDTKIEEEAQFPYSNTSVMEICDYFVTQGK